jgi:hypothetical protein
VWHVPRRRPARSFPFLSIITSMHEGEAPVLPTQVNLHVEVEQEVHSKSDFPQLKNEGKQCTEQHKLQEERMKLGEKGDQG